MTVGYLIEGPGAYRNFGRDVNTKLPVSRRSRLDVFLEVTVMPVVVRNTHLATYLSGVDLQSGRAWPECAAEDSFRCPT